MRQLVFSLDKKILDPSSAAAKRMVEYGQKMELYIIVPSTQKIVVTLSPTVRVYGSGGGNKPVQLISMCLLCHSLISKEKIELVTSQDPFFIGLLGLRVSHKFKIPFEVQVHGDFFGGQYYTATSFGKFKNYIAKFVLQHADTVRTVGERVKKSLLKIGINESKISIRPVALNSSPAETPAVVQGAKAFVWVGRMEPEKNLFFLLDVFKQVANSSPNAQLILIGEGSQKELLRQKVKKLSLEKNVVFVAWLPSPHEYVKNALALLLPSLTESYSAIAMEAHAAGTPVIMSDVGVANYELKPGPKVTILPINDKDAWVEAILKI